MFKLPWSYTVYENKIYVLLDTYNVIIYYVY